MKKKGKNFKLAILIGQMSYYGGVGIAAINEVRELRKMGYDAELLVLFRKKEFDSVNIFKANDIPVKFLSDELPRILRFNFKFPFLSFFSFFHVSAIFWLPFVLRNKKYDIILAHETYNCLSAVFTSKILNIPLISFVWDPVSYIVPRVYGKGKVKLILPVLVFLSKIIDGFILKGSDKVLICSSLHEEVLKKLNLSTKLTIVFPGTEILNKLSKSRGKIVVSLTKWDIGKNPTFLLEVAKRLRGDYQMLIAGNWVYPEFEEDFKNQIKSYGLSKKVILVGSIFGKEKIDFLSKARVLVHPIIEAFGMFGLEAAACGCPIILPRRSGVCELFKDGKQGFFPDENDIETFSNKINLLLRDEYLAIKMGKEAWKVSKNNTWKDHTEKILKVINS